MQEVGHQTSTGPDTPLLLTARVGGGPSPVPHGPVQLLLTPPLFFITCLQSIVKSC